ncbi:MAG: hypothetical protein WAN86_25870 [Hyphomicrobiaceae bacterium]
MRTVLRWFLGLLVRTVATLVLIVIVALAAGFAAFDWFYFQSQRPQIAQLIAAAPQEERNPPDTLVRLLRAASSRRIASWTYRVLYHDHANPTGIRAYGVGAHHPELRALLWRACLWLHLSEQEQVTLIVSRSRFYLGRHMLGYAAASQALFNRPLASLSNDEAATLVVGWHLGCFYGNSAFCAQRRDALLLALKEM